MLSGHLQQHKIEVRIAEDDTNLKLAREGWVVVVVSQDTDILVLLFHYMDALCGPLIFERKTNKWDIRKLKQNIGEKSENNKVILYMHAFLGCVSQIYNVAKDKLLKAQVAHKRKEDCKATQAQLCQAGNDLLLTIYGKPRESCLNSLRCKHFMEKVAVKTAVQPHSLPPTDDTAEQHFLGVYHQVQTWYGHKNDPRDWGWKEVDGNFEPVQVTNQPGPENLLKYVRCQCKEDGCAGNTNCSCTECNGVSCMNPTVGGSIC